MYPDPDPAPDHVDDPLADAIDDFIRKRMNQRMPKNGPIGDWFIGTIPTNNDTDGEPDAHPCPPNIEKNGGWPEW